MHNNNVSRCLRPAIALIALALIFCAGLEHGFAGEVRGGAGGPRPEVSSGGVSSTGAERRTFSPDEIAEFKEVASKLVGAEKVLRMKDEGDEYQKAYKQKFGKYVVLETNSDGSQYKLGGAMLLVRTYRTLKSQGITEVAKGAPALSDAELFKIAKIDYCRNGTYRGSLAWKDQQGTCESKLDKLDPESRWKIATPDFRKAR